MNATQEVFDNRTGRSVPVCDNCASRIEWGEESRRFDANHPHPLERTYKSLTDPSPRQCVFTRHPLASVSKP